MGCRPCARIILFTFNFLFFVCGVLLLAFGIVGIADPLALTRFLNSIPGVENTAVIINIPETVVASSVFMIILGSVMLVFGFLGCIGAWCMVKWMLFIYWFVLVIILLAEIALIIVAAVSPAKVEGHVKEVLYKSLKEKFTPVMFHGNNITLPSNIVAVAWISLQFEVSCCGANNYTDYSTFPWNKTINTASGPIDAVVPPSCCEVEPPRQVPTSTSGFKNLEQCLKGEGAYNKEGCYKTATKLMVQYSYAPIIIAAIVIFIELVAIATAIYLWKSNDQKKELV